jgi:dihydroorotate dehydrogenase (NAD+) catalytic subunit
MDVSVNLAPSYPKGLYLSNPVMTSAGTFGSDGYGSGLPKNFPFSELGAIVLKSTTLLPRLGNPEPHMEEQPNGWLNAIGLKNPGIHGLMENVLPVFADSKIPIILSLAADSYEDFIALAQIASRITVIDAIELNFGCPNTANGLDFGQNPAIAWRVTQDVKALVNMPVIVKLTPNVTDVVEIAIAVEDGGADAITAINTVAGMAVDWSTGRPALGNVMGGLSGPAIKPVALGIVYKLVRAVGIPVIGVGGISNADDAMEFLCVGASAIQVGSASLGHPNRYLAVIAGIVEKMEQQGLNDVPSLRKVIGV